MSPDRFQAALIGGTIWGAILSASLLGSRPLAASLLLMVLAVLFVLGRRSVLSGPGDHRVLAAVYLAAAGLAGLALLLTPPEGGLGVDKFATWISPWWAVALQVGVAIWIGVRLPVSRSTSG